MNKKNFKRIFLLALSIGLMIAEVFFFWFMIDGDITLKILTFIVIFGTHCVMLLLIRSIWILNTLLREEDDK